MSGWIRTGDTCLESGPELVWEGASPDALACFASTGRIAGLYHEAFYVPVKYTAIIVVGSTESEEVLRRLVELSTIKQRASKLTSAVFGTASQKTSI